MGLFIRVIAIDTQVLLVRQIVYGSTVIGKAIRFHGAVHILLGGFFCFSQSMVVASLVKAVFKMVVDNNLIPGSCFSLCIPEHSGTVCAKLCFLGVYGLFRFVVDGRKRILPVLGTALHGSGDSHIVLIPQLLHNLLQTTYREPAHFHTATGGNGAGYKLESQLRCSHLGILAVNFKEVPHLIQNNVIRVASLDTVVWPDRRIRLSIFHGIAFSRSDCIQVIFQYRCVLYPESLWGWVQFFQKILRNGLPMLIPIQNHCDGSAVVCLFPDVLDELLCICIRHNLARLPIGARVLNPAYGFQFRFRLCQGFLFLNFVVLRLFLFGQIPSFADQVGNPSGNLLPGEGDIRAVLLFEAHAFAVMAFLTVSGTGQGVGASANAMLVFQEICLFLVSVALLEEGKNTAFAPGDAAARGKGGVNFILGDVLRTGRNFHILRGKSPAGQIQIP